MNFWLRRQTIVALALSLLTLAEIVDLTIIAVALPDIMGALGANIDEISLTMTSYIVVAAIFIPLTGIVTKKIGFKTLSLASAIVFGIASILCGMATSLPEMIIFRIIQGIGGAFLPAVSQAYIIANFSQKEQPKILTISTLCIVLGPIIGPIVGGAIVAHLNWRWVFYVNVPICFTAFILILLLMENGGKQKVATDYISFIFMAVGIGFLEYFLTEGNGHNWFQSQSMLIIFAIGVLSLIFFIWRGLLGKSVIDLNIFKDANFNLSCFAMFMFMAVAILSLVYFPTLLQRAYGYPVDLAGYITSPRGMISFLIAPIIIQLAKKIDRRYIMFMGLLAYATANWLFCSYGANQNSSLILLSVTMQGIGLVGVFMMMTQIALLNVTPALSNDAAGVFNFFRNIGNSVGTSIAAIIISRQQQAVWHDLGGTITNNSNKLGHLSQYSQNITPNIAANHNILQLIAQLLEQQAFLVANLDVFYASLVGVLAISWIPFCLAKQTVAKDFVIMSH